MRQSRRLLPIILVSSINLGCATTQVEHPALAYPAEPELALFTRDLLDCGNHNPSTLPLCKHIVEREATLHDHIDTLEVLIDLHNTILE